MVSIEYLFFETRHWVEKHHEIVKVALPVVDEVPMDHRLLEPHPFERANRGLLLLDHSARR